MRVSFFIQPEIVYGEIRMSKIIELRNKRNTLWEAEEGDFWRPP